MPEPTPLSPTLARLLREPPDTWTLRLLWARMPLALRQEAVQSVLEDDSAESAPLRASLLRALARAGGFRAKMLEGQDPAKVALHAGRIRRRDLPGPGSLLSHFLTTRRRALLSAYLDALGVPHEEGKVEPGYDTEEEEDLVAHAAREVREAFPADDVAVYLVALTLTTPNLATGVPAWLRENLLPRPEQGKGAGPLPAPEAADEAETREPELIQEARTDGPEGEAAPGSPFTTLDRLLIRAVVDSAQEVRGAMGPLELEDLVGPTFDRTPADLDMDGPIHRRHLSSAIRRQGPLPTDLRPHTVLTDSLRAVYEPKDSPVGPVTTSPGRCHDRKSQGVAPRSPRPSSGGPCRRCGRAPGEPRQHRPGRCRSGSGRMGKRDRRASPPRAIRRVGRRTVGGGA
jgi:hypothetical protein